jgi:hypothetical protein
VPAKDIEDLFQHRARSRQGGNVNALHISQRVCHVVDQASGVQDDILHGGACLDIIALENG